MVIVKQFFPACLPFAGLKCKYTPQSWHIEYASPPHTFQNFPCFKECLHELMCFFNHAKSPQSLEFSPLPDSVRLNYVCNVLAFTDSLVGLPLFRALSGVVSSSSCCLSGVTWSLTRCTVHTLISASPQY